MAELFFSNIPFDCLEPELRSWVESRGFPTTSIRLIRDLVSGVSPAFAYVTLRDSAEFAEAIRVLHAQCLRGSAVQVKEDWRTAAAGKAA